ncbi:polyprenyl synthetase family protein [Desulfotomaculum copahuensis]|uniref:polyprenyl synthetase family protein n=1 Tax=Desulfotomaculum copahuensis TaxID=1838280 RepID=UPI000833E66A|nr:polyprenyl synthetase family protein [Desulfotomaculum copahuensis]
MTFSLAPELPQPAGLEELLDNATASAEPLVQQLIAHSLPGGKRLRPALVAITAGFYPADPAEVTRVAAAVELIHLASLVHDDVLDNAATRRSRPALHRLCGAVPAVLTGDYLFATAFGLLADTKKGILRIITRAIRTMCEGEIQELSVVNFCEEAYFAHIAKKTAALIDVACQSGGILCGMKRTQLVRLSRYGTHLGCAFQVVDDLLDLAGRSELLGKPCLQDLSQGILTLPVLHFLEVSPRAGQWKEKLRRGGLTADQGRELVAQARELGCLEYAGQAAQKQVRLAQEALEGLPAGKARDSLAMVAQKVLFPLHLLDHTGPAQAGAQPEQAASPPVPALQQ